MGHTGLVTFSKHSKEKKVIVSSKHGFTNRKLCLTDLIACYNLLTGLVVEWRALNVVYPDFSKAFNTGLHNILIYNLMTY